MIIFTERCILQFLDPFLNFSEYALYKNQEFGLITPTFTAVMNWSMFFFGLFKLIALNTAMPRTG